MAEVVGLLSGVLTLASFALKSCGHLRDEIQTFKSRPHEVRALLTELSGLTQVLQELSETGDLGIEVNFDALKLTLELCRQACDDVKAELLASCSQSGVDRVSFRAWAKLKCSGGDGIVGFRQQLIGYKSTITVALSFANLRASARSAEAIQACRDSLATSKIDLEARFEDIMEKVEAMAPRIAGSPNPDAVAHYIERERLSTEKALQFCAMLSEQIEKMQLDYRNQDPDSASGMLFGEGLEGCMHHIRFTLAHLEKRQKSLSERLSNGLNISSAEDQAAFEKLQNEAKNLRRCLVFCSDVDAYVDSQISNIENHAEGDDTIQFMVSTDGKPIKGKNRGIGKRLKQAGGHFGEASLQHMSHDFKFIALHQSGHIEVDAQHPVSPSSDSKASANPISTFGNRHGPGFVLAKAPAPSVSPMGHSISPPTD